MKMIVEKTLVKNLRTLVRAYARATGYSQVRISKELYGGAHFLRLLFENKRSVSLHKYSEMFDTLVAAWPEGYPFPTTFLVMKGPTG